MTLRRIVSIARARRRSSGRGRPLLAIGFLSDAAFIFIFLIALQSYLPESLHAEQRARRRMRWRRSASPSCSRR